MQVAVLGSGSWGTALALQLARANNKVFLWDRKPERAQKMQEERENSQYLPGIRFLDTITVSPDLDYVLQSVDMLVFAIPRQKTRAVIQRSLPLLNPLVPICCAS